jgi:hypothetical protein
MQAKTITTACRVFFQHFHQMTTIRPMKAVTLSSALQGSLSHHRDVHPYHASSVRYHTTHCKVLRYCHPQQTMCAAYGAVRDITQSFLGQCTSTTSTHTIASVSAMIQPTLGANPARYDPNCRVSNALQAPLHPNATRVWIGFNWAAQWERMRQSAPAETRPNRDSVSCAPPLCFGRLKTMHRAFGPHASSFLLLLLLPPMLMQKRQPQWGQPPPQPVQQRHRCALPFAPTTR